MEPLDAAGLLRRCGDSRSDAAQQSHTEWADLMARFGAGLESGARRALRRAGMDEHPDVLEDLVQEISTRLWERRASALCRFRGTTEAEVACYLRRLAENTATDSLRLWSAKKRRCRQPLRTAEGTLLEMADDRLPDPERWTLERERRRWLLAQMRALCSGRNARRKAWILRRALVDGWTPREIAAVLGSRAAETAIRALVYRARRRLARAAPGSSRC